MSEGLSQRAYAKHRGCNVSLINRWLKADRLVIGPDGKIDAARSDEALAASMDRTRGEAAWEARSPAMRKETGASEPVSNSMTNAKVACAVYDAKMKKLQYDLAIGKAFEADRVLSAARDSFDSLRRAIQQIADRIASPVAAETDPRKVHALLSAEHNAVLETVASVLESLPQRFTVTRQ